MSSSTHIKDFTKGNITSQLIKFSFPLFCANLLQVVYNMVDMVVVGNVIGKAGISAVAVGGDIAAFMTFIAMGFANAGQVIIAKYIGAGKLFSVSSATLTGIIKSLGSLYAAKCFCMI